MIERAPITIKFMLACHCAAATNPAEVVGNEHWNSPAGQEVRRWLRDNELVNANYGSTPRGKAWVQFICNTPLPVATWSLPERERGEIVE